MTRKLFMLVGAAFVAASLAGCPPPSNAGGGTGAGSTAGGTTGATSSGGASGGAIPIGYYGDLTGNTATFGTSARDGMLLALDEVNQDPPLGRKLDPHIEDDQGKPDGASTVVTKLINQDQVVAVIGEVASSNSLAAAPKCQDAKVPMITPASTNPQVTEVGDYIFRVCFIDPFQGSVMAKFARNSRKAQRAAILTDTKSDYSKGLTKFFKDEFTQLGGQIVAEQSYSQGDVNFTAQLNSIKGANPDVIYVPGYYNEVGTIARQARDQGITVPLLGGDGWDSPKLFESAGEALEGCFFSNHYSAESKDPRVVNFIKAFKEKFSGQTPDAMAALAYDATKIVADAIKRANATDGDALRKALSETKNFPGVSGDITIGADRNATKPAVVMRVEGKAFRYVETVSP